MDNTAQQNNQSNSPLQPPTPTQPVAQHAQQVVGPQAPGIVQREHEATAVPLVKQEAHVKPSESEPQLDPEVRDARVEVVKAVPDLTLEDKKAGIQLAKESTPVSTQPSGMLQLLMSREQAEEARKGSPADSKTFLGTLIWKIFHIKS